MKVSAYFSESLSIFVSCIQVSLNSVNMGHSNEQHHEHPTNKETLDWYKEQLKNGQVSEETFKREAIAFFNLSPENSNKSKQTFKKEIQNFVTMHVSMLKKMLRLVGELWWNRKKFSGSSPPITEAPSA